MNHAPQGDLAPVTVVCLCAEWCGVCRDYVQAFRQVQERIPHARMIWIDVEDEADLLHPLEVENFPTVLIACLLYTSPSPRDRTRSRMPSSA